MPFLPPERILFYPHDAVWALRNINVGDQITITDSDAGLSGSYRVFGRTITFEEGQYAVEYEVSNGAASILKDLEEDTDKGITLSKYMQGATNVFEMASYENCDASNPLNLRFRIPDDIVALNKALLSYKILNYRAYETGVASGGGSTSGSGAAHSHSLSIGSSGSHAHSTPNHDHTLFYYEADGGIVGVARKYWATFETVSARIELETLAGEDIKTYVAGGGSTSGTAAHTHTGIATNTESTHTHTTPNHVHTMNYAIDTSQGGADATVDIAIGPDSAESVYKVGQTALTDEDISAQIKAIGAGQWANIKFTPNKACRIEANAYIKCFIQSK